MSRLLGILLVVLVGISALTSILYVSKKLYLDSGARPHNNLPASAIKEEKEQDATGLAKFEAMPLLTARTAPRYKTVVITGHGRSGSTLTGSIFKGEDWVFDYEPLKLHDWPPLIRDRFDPAATSQCRLDELTVLHKMRCPIADMIYLLDLAHCRFTDLPLHALELEVDGGPGPDVIRALNATAPVRGTRDPQCMRRELLQGVAVKTIRINGHMSELFDLSEKLGLRLDLVIHLLRDPRAVLASRFSVGWGVPAKRSYEATLEWARDLCGRTMADARAGGGRVNYMMLRYEDLAAAAEQHTEQVYARLKRAVPPRVRERMKKNDQLSRAATAGGGGGGAAAAAGGGAARTPHIYGVGVRNFVSQLTKWRVELSLVEQQAVEQGCKEVLSTFYSDLDELLKKKDAADKAGGTAAAAAGGGGAGGGGKRWQKRQKGKQLPRAGK